MFDGYVHFFIVTYIMYDFISYVNEKSKISALVHNITTTYWTFEFVPFLMGEILEPMSDPPPTREELKGNEPFHMASIAYGTHMSDQEILDWMGHVELMYRENMLNNDHVVTHFLTTKEENGDIWFGIRGLDIRSFTSIGAVGCPYYRTMDEFGLQGKVITSFIPALFDNPVFHETVKTSDSKNAYVCGHSMGACMAIITGAYIARKRPDVRVKVYAFAPLMFYDEEFRNCVMNIENLELNCCLDENDVIVKLYNVMRITDKNQFKDFDITESSIPFVDSTNSIRNMVPVRDLSIFDVINPFDYIRHALWSYGNWTSK